MICTILAAIAALGLVGPVLGQSDCIYNCAALSGVANGCEAMLWWPVMPPRTDPTCMCSSGPFIDGIVQCIAATCPDEISSAMLYQQSFCKNPNQLTDDGGGDTSPASPALSAITQTVTQTLSQTRAGLAAGGAASTSTVTTTKSISTSAKPLTSSTSASKATTTTTLSTTSSAQPKAAVVTSATPTPTKTPTLTPTSSPTVSPPAASILSVSLSESHSTFIPMPTRTAAGVSSNRRSSMLVLLAMVMEGFMLL